MDSVLAQKFGSGGTINPFYRPHYAVNCWVQVPVGSPGTAQAANAENMRKEVAKAFRTGFSEGYGGSLSMFKLVLPEDEGIPHHEFDKTPFCLRFEVTLVGVKENE